MYWAMEEGQWQKKKKERETYRIPTWKEWIGKSLLAPPPEGYQRSWPLSKYSYIFSPMIIKVKLIRRAKSSQHHIPWYIEDQWITNLTMKEGPKTKNQEVNHQIVVFQIDKFN